MSNDVTVALVTSGITLVSASIGFCISFFQHKKTYNLQSKSLLAEKKLEIYVNYMSSVNQSWAQYKTSGNVNGELRQKGIDSFEALRILAPPAAEEKATVLNGFFSKLFPGYEINDDVQAAYNLAFSEMKVVAQKEFIIQ